MFFRILFLQVHLLKWNVKMRVRGQVFDKKWIPMNMENSKFICLSQLANMSRKSRDVQWNLLVAVSHIVPWPQQQLHHHSISSQESKELTFSQLDFSLSSHWNNQIYATKNQVFKILSKSTPKTPWVLANQTIPYFHLHLKTQQHHNQVPCFLISHHYLNSLNFLLCQYPFQGSLFQQFLEGIRKLILWYSLIWNATL